MIFKFLKTAIVSAVIVICSSADAALIQHGYTLDTSKNIVTDGTTEWMQWTETLGMSINSALATHNQDGWTLATNLQMAELLHDFGFDYTVDETDSVIATGVYVAGTDDAVEDIFLELFGHSIIVTGPIYGNGFDAWDNVFAIYGDDANQNGKYNSVQILSDGTNDELDNGTFVEFGGGAAFLPEWASTTFYDSTTGVALVRVITVQAPASVTILALSLLGLAARRFMKKS